jgi:hypothetical protein
MISPTEDPGKYLTQIEVSQIKLQFKITRLIDYRTCLKYFEESQTLAQPISTSTSASTLPKPKLYLKIELFDKGRVVCRPFETQIFHDYHIDSSVDFPYQFKKMSFGALLGFSLYSMHRDIEWPIACSTISLYDEILKLRKGPQLLLLWPERNPDFSVDSGTPGLVQEPFIDELTENCRKQDDLTTQMHSQPDGPDKSQLKAILADIQNTRMLLEKSVPFAFLEIDLQKFSGRTVVHSEPVRQINSRTNDPSSYEFSYFNLKKNFSAFPCEFSTIEKNFIPKPEEPDFPEFQDLLKVRDYDYDLSEQHERDLVLELSYKLWDQNEEGPDVQNLIPNSDVQRKIKQTLKSPPYKPLSDVKRTTMYKYRYWIKGQYPQA